MLIEFCVGNYRSFRDPVTLSMVAANLRLQDKQLDENNVFDAGRNRDRRLARPSMARTPAAKAIWCVRWGLCVTWRCARRRHPTHGGLESNAFG